MEPTVHWLPDQVERRVERAVLAKVGAFVITAALFVPASLSAAAHPVLVADAADFFPTSSEASTFAFSAALVDLPEVIQVTPRSLPPEAEEVEHSSGIVVASWYGPGFFGNRTACGQTLTEDVVGLAHRSLPCGTFVQLTSPAGITITAPVIDRGPYVSGRSLDLSAALKQALSCTDLCWVRMAVVPR